MRTLGQIYMTFKDFFLGGGGEREKKNIIYENVNFT